MVYSSWGRAGPVPGVAPGAAAPLPPPPCPSPPPHPQHYLPGRVHQLELELVLPHHHHLVVGWEGGTGLMGLPRTPPPLPGTPPPSLPSIPLWGWPWHKALGYSPEVGTHLSPSPAGPWKQQEGGHQAVVSWVVSRPPVPLPKLTALHRGLVALHELPLYELVGQGCFAWGGGEAQGWGSGSRHRPAAGEGARPRKGTASMPLRSPPPPCAPPHSSHPRWRPRRAPSPRRREAPTRGPVHPPPQCIPGTRAGPPPASRSRRGQRARPFPPTTAPPRTDPRRGTPG